MLFISLLREDHHMRYRIYRDFFFLPRAPLNVLFFYQVYWGWKADGVNNGYKHIYHNIKIKKYPCHFKHCLCAAGAHREVGFGLGALVLYHIYCTSGSHWPEATRAGVWIELSLSHSHCWYHSSIPLALTPPFTTPLNVYVGKVSLEMILIQAPAWFFQNIWPQKLLNLLLSRFHSDQMVWSCMWERFFQLAQPRPNLFPNCHPFRSE